MPATPLKRSYWIKEPLLLAGVYAGAPGLTETKSNLRSLLTAGIRSICNLTEATEGLRDYEADLAGIAEELGVEAVMKRFAITDVSTTSPKHMRQILDWIDGETAENRPVYLHCQGGIGRTGMVAGGNANATPREGLRPGALQRARGCLMGQLVGDSLGSLVEFRSAQSIRGEYPNGVRELADGGTWQTIAGQPTDDSEMALALARTIVRLGDYDLRQAGLAYKQWLDSHPFDVGNTIRGSLRGAKNPDSQANGALMRVSPLGIFAARFDRNQAALWAKADAELTHTHPVCLQANALFTMAIAEAVATGPAPQELWNSVEQWAKNFKVDVSLLTAISRSGTGKPNGFLDKAGWVLIAFQNALYQLLHAATFEEAIVDTVMQGGDTDTNAAICGALLGAVHGIEAIPERWSKTVLACRPEAGRPGVEHPRPAEYWPGDALELAESLLGAGRFSAE